MSKEKTLKFEGVSEMKMTRIVFCLVIITLFVFVVSISGEAKCQSVYLSVYETGSPNWVTPQNVLDIAVDVFNITASIDDVESFTEGYFVNSSYPLYLEVYFSGSIWYCDHSKFFDESYDPALPSESSAESLAEQFLNDHQVYLRPDNAIYHNIGYTTTTTYDCALETVTSNITNNLNVNFAYQVDGYPVRGPGAEITVTLGDGGEIIGFHRVWKGIGNALGSYEVITVGVARERLSQRLDVPEENVVITEECFAYYAEPGFAGQDYIQPVYVFNGYVTYYTEQIEFKTQVIPATSFSPVVSIVSPIDGDEFFSDEIITFDASVSDGNPPYTYIWESHVAGEIGNIKSFSRKLSALTRGGVVAPHSIILTVIDSKGNEAGDIISVAVKPVGVGGVSIPVDKLEIFMAWITTPSILLAVIACVTAMVVLVSLRTGRRGRKGLVGLSLATIIIISTLMSSLVICEASPQDDSNKKEVGIEWVNKYGGKGRLKNNHKNARGFKNKLVGDGWKKRFDWGDSWAWEEDFKYRNGPNGGTDYQWIDAVDFAYFSGHGSPTSILFSESRWDQQDFLFSRARWGGDDGGTADEQADLEWIVLDACETLKKDDPSGDVWDRWDQAFKGLHIILGFHTTCHDEKDRGKKFAEHMIGWWIIIKGKKICDAWIKATKETEGHKVYGAYLRGQGTRNDHLPGHGHVGNDPYPVTTLTYCKWSC